MRFFMAGVALCGLMVIIMLSGCDKQQRYTHIEPEILSPAELNSLRPAAGHLMMDYIPEVVERSPMSSLPPLIESPIWKQNAALGYGDERPLFGTEQRPKIVVVIDDLGPNYKNTKRVAKLPAPLTLAYLPYADHVAKLSKKARARGHELMVHMPMQPTRDNVDPGPNALEVNLSEAELMKRIKKNLSAFDGYVGINNHMGSAFTRDNEGLETLMEELRVRDILYLDSRTVPDSRAEDIARNNGVATTTRDVFIDHLPNAEFISGGLAKTERVARTHGTAIAIGHPYDATIDALEAWLPTLSAKGFDLVPITAVMEERDPRLKGMRQAGVR